MTSPDTAVNAVRTTVSDEEISELLAFEGDLALHAAVDPFKMRALLTELQHRREAEAGTCKSCNGTGGEYNLCSDCGGSGIEFVYGGHGNVLEVPCSTCAASPSSPASGVRVKVKPLEWHGPDFEDEYWSASLDLKYVIHPPNERGVRWLGGVGGYFRLVDEAKSVAEKHNEARIRSALEIGVDHHG